MIGWFNNLKMQTKLLTLFSIITLLGTIATGWNVYNVIELRNEMERMLNEAEEITEVEAIQVHLLEEQIAMLDYTLSGDEKFLVNFEEAEELGRLYLRQAVIDANTYDERDALGLLSEEIAEYNAVFEEVVELHDAGKVDEARQLAIDTDAIEQERLGRMHEQVERFVYKGTLTLEDDLAAADARTKQVITVGVFTLLLFALFAVLSSVVTNQVAEPILHMTNAIVAFENDAYEPELLEVYLKRREELGQLARAFNNMVNSITTSAREQAQLLEASSLFVPTAYLEFLQKPSIVDIKLGDHVSAEMAVMFSDIRSFTTISEGMTPQQNFDFVNDYLKQVSPVIQEHEGFIVKFLGDGMMAIFPYDVESAVKAGIEKMNAVAEFNADRTKRGELSIDLGIGIHTGHMMVGMIGEEGRMQGDAFSDNVNLTARIEGLTKFFGISMIISGDTLTRLEEPDKYLIRPLGKVQVKGRANAIALYEVFDADLEERRQLKLETRDDYIEALRLYTLGSLDEAADLFRSVLERHPDDKTSAMYLDLTQNALADGKPDYWDGVIVMTSK